jgi:hypothetical protein
MNDTTKLSPRTIYFEIVKGNLDDENLIVNIFVLKNYILSERETIYTFYEYPSDKNYIIFKALHELGFNSNIDWACWIQEYALEHIPPTLPEENFFWMDINIIKIQSVNAKNEYICFKCKCGLSHMAKKFGDSLERIGKILRTIRKENGKG